MKERSQLRHNSKKKSKNQKNWEKCLADPVALQVFMPRISLEDNEM